MSHLDTSSASEMQKEIALMSHPSNSPENNFSAKAEAIAVRIRAAMAKMALTVIFATAFSLLASMLLKKIIGRPLDITECFLLSVIGVMSCNMIMGHPLFKSLVSQWEEL
jgi:hypothetical protein